MRLFAVFLVIFLAAPAAARTLDPGAPANALLEQLAPRLEAQAIDVAHNLNSARLKPRRKPGRPRLGMLADMPLGMQVNSAELEHWESSYRDRRLLAIAAIPARNFAATDSQFLNNWFANSSPERVFITLASADRDSAG
ncbi:MAG: hypothetical protein O7F73_17745, partial [Gammaproteobacteria bacterium]|nr:hypothetical protein [Gammaproteobacteria bacterium]